MDYGALSVTLVFEACDKRKCVYINISDDEVGESDESFTYHLMKASVLNPRINLGPVDGQIEIVDNDGK